MAAFFIKKNDGNFYMRLTDNTQLIYFSAVSSAGNTYTFSIESAQNPNNPWVISKPYDDAGGVYYTTNADPKPAGSGPSPSDSRFPGAEISYSYPGSGIRDYSVSFTSTPVPGTQFYLGGASLNWGTNLYAYPGSGYISNPLAVGVKTGGSWKNSGNLFIKNNNQWKEVQKAWIKQNGTWKQFFQNYGNSSWINMLEGTDDAIDFAVQVHAIS